MGNVIDGDEAFAKFEAEVAKSSGAGEVVDKAAKKPKSTRGPKVEAVSEQREDAAKGDRAADQAGDESAPLPPNANSSDKKEESDAEREAKALNNARKVEDNLGFKVVGYRGSTIFLYSANPWRVQDLHNSTRAGLMDFLKLFGTKASIFIKDGDTDEDERIYTEGEVQRAIHLLACGKEIAEADEKGAGIWRIPATKNADLNVALVNKTGCHVYLPNSGHVVRLEAPKLGDSLLTPRDIKTDWYDSDTIEQDIRRAQSPVFRCRCLKAVKIYADNWVWKKGGVTSLLVSGLIPSTIVQDFFVWRPQVALNGATGAGKSAFARDFIEKMLGSLCKRSDAGSEAGFRQNMGRSKAFSFIDEFDSTKKRKLDQLEGILKYVRSAGGGSEVPYGTASHEKKAFHAKHTFWLSGITPPITDQADDNRFIRIDAIDIKPSTLRRTTPKPLVDVLGNSRQRSSLPDKNLRRLGRRLIACAIVCAEEARNLAVALRDESKAQNPGVTGRTVENFAVPSAMIAAMQGRGIAMARDILSRFLAEYADDINEKTDNSIELMHSILNHVPQHQSSLYVHRNVATLISDIRRLNGDPDGAAAAILSTVGLKVDHLTPAEKNEDRIRHTRETRALFLDPRVVARIASTGGKEFTPKAVTDLLDQLPVSGRCNRHIGGTRGRGMMIGLEWLREHFINDDPARAAPVQDDWIDENSEADRSWARF